MLKLATRLPPGALVGSEDQALAQAVLRSGGARFVAREADLVRKDGQITGWREALQAVEAVATPPNAGNTRFDPGPPGALLFERGMHCGFVIADFAPEVTEFSLALIYRSDGEARTLAAVSAGQVNNMIFLTETEGKLIAKDRENTIEVAVSLPEGSGAKLVVLSYDGRRLALTANGRTAVAEGHAPNMAHPGDFFIGCRSNRPGLTKKLGRSRLQEVMFWPDRALEASSRAEDNAVLAMLKTYHRWAC